MLQNCFSLNIEKWEVGWVADVLRIFITGKCKVVYEFTTSILRKGKRPIIYGIVIIGRENCY